MPIDSADVCERFVGTAGVWASAPSLSFSNPSLMRWRSEYSFGSVAAGYDCRRDSRSVSVQSGRSETAGIFDARAYIHASGSTLWGKAAYRNGKRRDVQWNEAADYGHVYPYVSADETGGPMDLEIYSFSGGYAGHKGRWNYGAAMSYDAGLYFRKTDPRPRDVTGDLHISAGAAYSVRPDYLMGLSVLFERYTQASDIMFVSEMGETTIYHLTGLGTHYARFDGVGKTTSYKGYTYGASVNVFPTGNGAFVSLQASRMTLDYIITDLNRLPMAALWQNSMTVQAGLRAGTKEHRWAACLDFDVSRRHGTENIFGDAASSVYPQIASLEMFADNRLKAGLEGVYEHVFPGAALRPRLGIKASFAYSHARQVHLLPFRAMEVNMWNVGLGAVLASRLSGRLAGHIDAGAYVGIPGAGCLLDITEGVDTDVDRMLASAVSSNYDCASARMFCVGSKAGIMYALNRRYAVGIEAAYAHRRYSLPVDVNEF
ncbi:MAG: hypothetical protein K2O12_00850, partial [Muribaculaceae bacterium]|nr:hypothetical protein [Muribaculaceae bacterium]